MPDHRKPPVEKSSRPEGATLPSDSGGFSIETTTMRLKSLRLRRSESATPKIEPQTSRTETVDLPRGDGPSGRVRHDERGMAVWDWAVATGEFATLSTARALKKLEIADLQIEDHKTPELKLEASGRDKAGGFDPYNQRGSGKRQGEAAQRTGVTGSADRDRAAVLDQLLDKK
jgi:CubicO group peptidase (beta-lactamase class C family)